MAAAITNAIKASGVLVRVKPEEVEKILSRAKDPLVAIASVVSAGGIWIP
jgi:hypothetical protein